jgi:hypothetical protein
MYGVFVCTVATRTALICEVLVGKQQQREEKPHELDTEMSETFFIEM